MISVDEIPDPRESPVGSARHHLQRAFAALRCKLIEIHEGVVHAHTLAAREHRLAGAKDQTLAIVPALGALARELAEVEAAKQMCERLLWRAVGDPAAQARWMPGDLAVQDGRVVQVQRVSADGATCDLLWHSPTSGSPRTFAVVPISTLLRPAAPQWRVGDVAGAAGACDAHHQVSPVASAIS